MRCARRKNKEITAEEATAQSKALRDAYKNDIVTLKSDFSAAELKNKQDFDAAENQKKSASGTSDELTKTYEAGKLQRQQEFDRRALELKRREGHWCARGGRLRHQARRPQNRPSTRPSWTRSRSTTRRS